MKRWLVMTVIAGVIIGGGLIVAIYLSTKSLDLIDDECRRRDRTVPDHGTRWVDLRFRGSTGHGRMAEKRPCSSEAPTRSEPTMPQSLPKVIVYDSKLARRPSSSITERGPLCFSRSLPNKEPQSIRGLGGQAQNENGETLSNIHNHFRGPAVAFAFDERGRGR